MNDSGASLSPWVDITQPKPHSQTSFSSLIPKPHFQASFPNLILKPHSQASFPSLILKPHSQASFPSLILKPHSQTSFSFSSLTVCKQGGGRLGPFYHTNDISTYLGRHKGGREGSPIEKMSLRPHFVVFCHNHWSFKCSQSKTYYRYSLFKMKNARANTFLDWDPLSPSAYLGRHWRHSCDKMDQAFPLHFCMVSLKVETCMGSGDIHFILLTKSGAM